MRDVTCEESWQQQYNFIINQVSDDASDNGTMDDEPWPKKSLVGVTYCVMLYTDNYWLEYFDKREESTLLCDRGRAPNYISCKCIQ